MMKYEHSTKSGRGMLARAGVMLVAVLGCQVVLTTPAYAIHFEPLPAEACKLQPMTEEDPPLKCGSQMMGNPATQSCFRGGGSLLLGRQGTGFCWTTDNASLPRGLTERSYSSAAAMAIGTCIVSGRAAQFTLGRFGCVAIPRAVAELARNATVGPGARP